MFEDYGFIQLLHAQLAQIIGTLFVVMVLYILARMLIRRVAEDEPRKQLYYLANWTAFIVVILVSVGFMLHAASMATNKIPRTGFDRGEVLERAIGPETGDYHE